MSDLIKNKFARLSTVVVFAAIAVLIIHPYAWSSLISPSLLLSLNLLIVASAICFSIPGIRIFAVAGLLLILSSNFPTPGLKLFSLILLSATALIIYFYSLRVSRVAQSNNVELENIDTEKNILAVELNRLRLENNALKQKLHRYTTLKDLTETLSSILSLRQTTSLITQQTFDIINKSSACLLYLVDNEKQGLYLAGTSTEQQAAGIKAKAGDVFDDWVFRRRTRLMIKDVNKDFRFNIDGGAAESLKEVRSLIAAPLICGNKILGILRLNNTKSEAYDTDDLRLLDIISDLAAVAIQNTTFYQKTQKLAITDGLTGLFVHRYFQERFEQEISRTFFSDGHFAFLMLDIDNFKSYNDKYGHIAGDIVLKQIARLIKESCNPGDIVARYGGEEFAILLVQATKKQALATAERIRNRISGEKFILRREVSKVTISGGISFFPDDDKTKEGLIRKADTALYQAKSKGKNKICLS